MWLFGLVLIVFGAAVLLSLFHVVPGLLTAGVLWPLVLVVLGLDGLRKFRRRRIPWWSFFLIILGAVLSLRNSGYVHVLSTVNPWSLGFAIFIVFLGLVILAPKRWGGPSIPVVRIHRDKHGHSVDVNVGDVSEIVSSVVEGAMGAKRNRDKRGKRGQGSRRMIGDISLGSQPWVLRDLDLWNGIGDVRINLATAHVEDGEYVIDIGGLVGDVRLLVPQQIAISVEAELKIGDVKVFGNELAGLGRHLQHEDEGFDQAPKRVHVHVELLVGDISIVRV